MLSFFVYIALTMLLTWAIQTMRLFNYIFDNKFFEIIRLSNFIHDLRSCRLCLGYWVALGLYFLLGEATFTDIIWIDCFLVALLVDLLAHFTVEGIIRNYVTVRI